MMEKKKRKRKRRKRGGTFGVNPRIGGWDLLSWPTYNDYERCLVWTSCACLCEVVAFVDINNNERAMPYYVKAVAYGLIRSFFDLTLFQMTSAYRTTLLGRRDWGFVISGSAAVVYQVLTNFMEVQAVPRSARFANACWNNDWNVAKHFGGAVVETLGMLWSVKVTLQVRERLKKDTSATRKTKNERVVRGIIMRVLMIGGIAFASLLYGIYIGFRNHKTRARTCSQPYCTLPHYLGSVFWAICYVAVNWYALIFFGIGRPSAKSKRPALFSRPSAIARPRGFFGRPSSSSHHSASSPTSSSYYDDGSTIASSLSAAADSAAGASPRDSFATTASGDTTHQGGKSGGGGSHLFHPGDSDSDNDNANADGGSPTADIQPEDPLFLPPVEVVTEPDSSQMLRREKFFPSSSDSEDVSETDDESDVDDILVVEKYRASAKLTGIAPLDTPSYSV